MDKEIVIVGAGPIGSWTALQLKLRDPELAITVYERREIYQRDHIMTIKGSSFQNLYAAGFYDDKFRRDISNLQSTCSELCRPRPRGLIGKSRLPGTIDVRTIDFERMMKTACQHAGIRFIYREVEQPQQIMDAHPDCQFFIAADGAKSRMRRAVWGENDLYQRDILPSVDIIYYARGQTRYLLDSTFANHAHVGLENIKIVDDNGLCQVNLRFVVSQQDYDAIPDATFKNPLTVEPNSPFWDKMSRKPLYSNRTFKDDFYDFLRMRKEHVGEEMADAPIKMTKIYLARYSSPTFAKAIDHGGRSRTWFLVGDAAMGMPFYRSVNSGLILGSQLAFLLTRSWSPGHKALLYNKITRTARVVREYTRTTYLEYKAHTLLRVVRPILFHAARLPGCRRAVVGPFDYVAKWRGARFP